MCVSGRISFPVRPWTKTIRTVTTALNQPSGGVSNCENWYLGGEDLFAIRKNWVSCLIKKKNNRLGIVLSVQTGFVWAGVIGAETFTGKTNVQTVSRKQNSVEVCNGPRVEYVRVFLFFHYSAGKRNSVQSTISIKQM